MNSTMFQIYSERREYLAIDNCGIGFWLPLGRGYTYNAAIIYIKLI